MLDIIGTLFMGFALVAGITTVALRIDSRPAYRAAMLAAAAAWTALAVAVSASGALRNPGTLGALLSGPLAATALLAMVSPSVRARLLAIPLPTLIGVNVLRGAGFLFLLLAAAGRLDGPFPQSAGWGDILAGVLAIPVAALAARGAARYRRAIASWNVFGTLDLIIAVALGVTSAPGSPLQLIHAGVGSAAVTSLPWSLIPTVLVPFFLVLHGIVFARLRLTRTDEHGRSPVEGLPGLTAK